MEKEESERHEPLRGRNMMKKKNHKEDEERREKPAPNGINKKSHKGRKQAIISCGFGIESQSMDCRAPLPALTWQVSAKKI